MEKRLIEYFLAREMIVLMTEPMPKPQAIPPLWPDMNGVSLVLSQGRAVIMPCTAESTRLFARLTVTMLRSYTVHTSLV